MTKRNQNVENNSLFSFMLELHFQSCRQLVQIIQLLHLSSGKERVSKFSLHTSQFQAF